MGTASSAPSPRMGGAVSLIVAIVAAAIVAAGVSYAMAPRPAARTPQTLDVYMIAGDFGFDAFLPGTLTVWKGDTVRVHIVNTENETHDFHIDELNVHATIPDVAGQVTDVTIVASVAGTFVYYCAIHAPEMRGYLTVHE